jgi:hypothetical protein
MNAENQKLLLIAGEEIDRSLCLITNFILLFIFNSTAGTFLQTGFAGFCTALFSELPKIIFAKPNSILTKEL